jgi:hypothetical protein
MTRHRVLRVAAAVVLLTAAAAATATAAATTAPSWPAPPPAEVPAAAHRAGLETLGEEGTVLHVHVHLDVFVDGRPVTVPAGIGIDPVRRLYSELHTHDTSGVIHVEAPRQAVFTLGQFMAEWGHPIPSARLGAPAASPRRAVTVWLDGRLAEGDPAAVPLREHDEIALVLGGALPSAPLPADYDWSRRPGL